MTSTEQTVNNLRNIIGSAWQLPQLDASIDEIENSAVFANLTDKQLYLEWVSRYKEVMQQVEHHQRAHKSKRKFGTELDKAQRMFELSMVADLTTHTIHLRRLGKIWAAAQAVKSAKRAA
jgi:hypothetical protein